MRFAHPQMLWLLVAVPAAAIAYGLAFGVRRRRLARLGDASLIAKMSEGTSVARKLVRAALAVATLALALARPQWPGQAVPAKQLGLDLVIALDFSRSMLAKDVYPSRLERAKREIGELLDLFAGDRVGIVAFAGETLTYPPTTDYDAVKLFWRDLNPWDMPVGGTAIGRAIRAGLDQLVPLRAKETTGGAQRGQAILLLTDGEDTDSEPLDAADEASKLGVKIFTVGVGSRSGELIPEYDDKGKVTGYVKDAEGKYVTSRLGEEMLAEIAKRTGGELFHADAKRFGVEDVARALTSLKRTENDGRPVPRYDELFQGLVIAALVILCAEAVIGERRRRRKAVWA
jgi:Ca-activated chloride channel family protein